MTEGTVTVQAALKNVADAASGPLSAAEIVDGVLAQQVRLRGATPRATVQAGLYTAAKDGRLFRRVGRGQFVALNGSAEATL